MLVYEDVLQVPFLFLIRSYSLLQQSNFYFPWLPHWRWSSPLFVFRVARHCESGKPVLGGNWQFVYKWLLWPEVLRLGLHIEVKRGVSGWRLSLQRDGAQFPWKCGIYNEVLRMQYWCSMYFEGLLCVRVCAYQSWRHVKNDMWSFVMSKCSKKKREMNICGSLTVFEDVKECS